MTVWLAILTTTVVGAAAHPLVGSWQAPPCGERTYERQITVDADGTWSALDLVAPCPKGAMCAWSGVVPSEGTWTAAGDALTLKAKAPSGIQQPTTRLTPSETGADGTEMTHTCAYVRSTK